MAIWAIVVIAVVFVFAADEPLPHLDDRDLGAEASKHLTEFETDVTAADDDQVPRKKVHRHHRAIGERVDLAKPRHVGNERPAADVDEDLVRVTALSAELTSCADSKRAWPR